MHVAGELAVRQRPSVLALTRLAFFHELVHDLLGLLAEHSSVVLHRGCERGDEPLLFSRHSVVYVFPL